MESKQADMLHHACQQFLGMSDEKIKSVVLQTLEGHQRAIMGACLDHFHFFSSARYPGTQVDLAAPFCPAALAVLSSLSSPHPQAP